MENITLYFKQGSSDKIYQAAIEPSGGKYVVIYAYGRRGTTLQTGTKTNTPVDYDTAKAVFDKLVREKTAKGYTPGEDGTPYQHTDNAGKTTGILPQLLNPIDATEVEKFTNDGKYAMQEKFDGKRMLILKAGAEIHGINRKGLIVGLPSPMVVEVHALEGDIVIDGEVVGDDFFAFDLLSFAAGDIRSQSYKQRYLRLMNVLASFQHPHIRLAKSVITTRDKKKFLGDLLEAGKEGIVFKNLDAPYTAGRPASGGNQFKHKFYETASFIVGKVNGKRSVSLLLYDGDNLGMSPFPQTMTFPSQGRLWRCVISMRSGNQARFTNPSTLARVTTSPAVNAR
jgi:bifunctional non-homologous end joining protein LigD